MKAYRLAPDAELSPCHDFSSSTHITTQSCKGDWELLCLSECVYYVLYTIYYILYTISTSYSFYPAFAFRRNFYFNCDLMSSTKTHGLRLDHTAKWDE